MSQIIDTDMAQSNETMARFMNGTVKKKRARVKNDEMVPYLSLIVGLSCPHNRKQTTMLPR